ncbi:MAG: hypothetical protein IJR00_06065 [Lachnospiraceae bacterium]|nr:hypothetical protein [Lachnospiraceae bacterium]
MSDKAMIIAFAALLLILYLPAFIIIIVEGRKIDPLDERQQTLNRAAYRDAVAATGLLAAGLFIWHSVCAMNGFAAPTTTTAALYIIIVGGISFYSADCVVRDIHVGWEVKINQKTNDRLVIFLAAMSIALAVFNASTSADAPPLRASVFRAPVPFSMDLFIYGIVVFELSMCIPILVKNLMRRKTAACNAQDETAEEAEQRGQEGEKLQ